MSFVTSSTDALLPPKLPGGELQAETSGTVTFTVGPWTGFNEGDTVQLLGGFGNQILGSTVVIASKSFLSGSAKVDTVNVPVVAATLRELGVGACAVRARWIHKNGEAFGSKLSPETTIQIRSVG